MPDYTGFWRAFQASDAWRGLRDMALMDEQLEARTVRLELVMRDAMDGFPQAANIQLAIRRVMEIVEPQMTPEAAVELAGAMQAFGLAGVYEVPGVEL